MGTDWLGTGLSRFVIHKVSELEGGYYYYGYMHRNGKVIIMREKQDESEYKFADGGFNPLATIYASRDTLDYYDWNEL